jgi:hypothetical protein
LRDACGGATLRAASGGLRAADVFRRLPVALLLAERGT